MNEIEYIYFAFAKARIQSNKVLKLREKLVDIRNVLGKEYSELEALEILKKEELDSFFNVIKEKKVEEEYYKFYDKGIFFTCIEDSVYPDRLKEIPDPPAFLFYKGKYFDNQKSVAIVGARNCSDYGRMITEMVVRKLASNGVNIISGLARGIDGIAHKTALDYGGNTTAVLGCGVDRCYPRENIEIYSRIQDTGIICSEYYPKTEALAYNFPRRNRIISGLSDCVVLIEAREKSGSLITVDQALEQGREVFVTPGRIGDKLSYGCNKLISFGASILLEPEDILEFLGVNYKKNQNVATIKNILSDEELKVLACIELYPTSFNDIIEKTGLDISAVLGIIFLLVKKKLIKETSKNYYIRVL